MRGLRSWVVVVALVLGAGIAGGAWGADASQPTRQVPVPWQIVWEQRAIGEGCGIVAFLQISEVKGAVSYAVTVVDKTTTTYRFSGPPFPGDATDFAGTIVRAPKGTHRWSLSSSGSSSGGGAGCAEAKAGFLAPSRWKVTSATATVVGEAKEEATITGRVVESVCDEKTCEDKGLAGVMVSAAGAGGGSARTGAGGRYSITVDPGSYVVRPSLAGREFTPSSATVSAPKGGTGTANFSTCAVKRTPQGRQRSSANACLSISGVVLRRKCVADRGCPPYPYVDEGEPRVDLRITGGSTVLETETDAEGRFRVFVKPGRYTVRVVANSTSVKPLSRSVTVAQTSVDGLHFHLCKDPEVAGKRVPCDLVRIEGIVVEPEKQHPYPYPLTVGAEGYGEDADPNFVIFVKRGRVQLTYSFSWEMPGFYQPTPALKGPVLNATRDMKGVRIVVRPWVGAEHAVPPSAPAFIVWGFGGLPRSLRQVQDEMTALFERDEAVLDTICRYRWVTKVRNGRTQAHLRNERWCPGNYTVTLRDPYGDVVARSSFRITGKS